MHGGHPEHSRHIDRGIADRYHPIEGGNLTGEAVKIYELIDFSVMDDAAAGELPQSLEVFLDIPILQRNERRRLPAEQWHPTPGSIGLLLGSDVAGGRRRPARLSTSRARAARRRLARSCVRRSASPRHRAYVGSCRP